MISGVADSNLICFKPLVIQQVRPHVGQRRVAERLRSLLHSRIHHSEIAGKCALHTYIRTGQCGWATVLCVMFNLVHGRPVLRNERKVMLQRLVHVDSIPKIFSAKMLLENLMPAHFSP